MELAGPDMSTLPIRNLDAWVKEGLRVRVARDGRSMEAEVRAILAETLAPQARAEHIRRETARRHHRLGCAFPTFDLHGAPIGRTSGMPMGQRNCARIKS